MDERPTAPAWVPRVVEAFHGWSSVVSGCDKCFRGDASFIPDEVELEVAERGRSVREALATIEATGGLWTGEVDHQVAIAIENAVEAFDRYIGRYELGTAIAPGWEEHQAR